MLGADEVDIDFFTPVASTTLAKIFGGDTKAEENASLKYVPKLPQNQPLKEEDSKATKVIYACAVNGYEWLDSAYKHRGKLGAAIIKNLKSGQHNIILYDTNKTTISYTAITSKLEVIIKGGTNLSFYDDQKRYWNIYGTQVEVPCFVEELKSLNVLVKDSSNQINEPTEKSFSTNDMYNVSEKKDQEHCQEQQHPKDEKESDTDARHKKTRDTLLKRMATMGHSVLPIQSLKSTMSSDTSESDEGAPKVVRHKPQKSNIRKSLPEKADHPSDSYSEIDLIKNMPIINHPANIPLSQQQLVPIKSTNIITNPIINNSNELSLFMSEQRLSNAELRINMNRLSDKMEKIFEKVENDSGNKSSSRHFENNIIQKLLHEYENKINYYENFLQSKGFDLNVVAKPMDKEELPTNNINDLAVQDKIQELQNQLEEKNKENSQLKSDLETLNEKYLSCCSEFKQTCNDHTKEISKLKQELSSKQEEIATENCENIVLPNNDIQTKLKSIMNETFHSLSANFDNNENYTGPFIKSVIASVIKKETIKALKEV